VCSWHEHHDRAAEEIKRRLDRGEKMAVAAPALIEAYAVLTRLPPPHRLAPVDALTLLEANFIKTTKIVALEGKSYRNLLRQVTARGISGGHTYDAVIAACALKAKIAALLTFNESDFLLVSNKTLEVVVPGKERL
jgi:predicted nucleic acid-binding protein